MRLLTILAATALLLAPSRDGHAQIQTRDAQAGNTVRAFVTEAGRHNTHGRTDPAQRRQVLHALSQIRAELDRADEFVSTIASAALVTNPPDDSSETGGFSGYVVVDAEDGGGGADSSASAWVLAVALDVAGNPTAWQSTSVDADGRYAFGALHHGPYIVLAGAEGVQSLFFRQAVTMSDAEPVGVAPGVMLEGIDFFLASVQHGSGAISGTVRDAADGLSIAGAEVFAYSIEQPYRGFAAQADSSGAYLLPDLFSGHYIVQASAPGHFSRFYDDAPSYELASPVIVSNDAVSEGIDFSLPRSGSISGKVIDSDGNPIAYADIFVQTERGPESDSLYSVGNFWTQADANGRYVVSGLHAGEYFVLAQSYTQWFVVGEWYDGASRIEDATPVIVTEGEETRDINFELDLTVDTGRMSGRVTTADGEPVPNAYIHAESFDDVYTESAHVGVYAFTQTDSDGRYVFDGIPTGTYAVSLQYVDNIGFPWLQIAIWYDGVYSRGEATPVIVAKDASTDGIDFQLARADGVIEGTITDSDGKPVANANVYASRAENFYPTDPDSGYVYGNGFGYARTDANGTYRIEGLIDGDYYVSASACLFWQCVERWWPDAAFFPDARPVVVTDGTSDPAAVDISLPLTQGSATLAGTVHHADGRLLAGAWVTVSLTSDATHGPEGDTLYWNVEMQTPTDSSGAYAFHNLPEGDYIVNASYWEAGGYAVQWYDGVDSPREATIIRLANSDVVEGIDFTLEPQSPFGSLSGRVFLGEASPELPPDSLNATAPIGRAYVEVLPYHWDYATQIIDPMHYHAVTRDDGGFQIDGIANGRYYVNVYAQSARVPDGFDEGRFVVDITGGGASYVEVVLVRTDEGPGAIAGTVIGADGAALDIAVIVAIPNEDPNHAFTAISEPGGRYKLTGLPPGEFVLWSFAPFHATEYYDNVYDPSDATRIQLLDVESIAGIDFTLDPVFYITDAGDPIATRASYIYGKVTNEHGDALSKALVYVIDDEGQIVQSARTHADGMYEIAGLTPGNGIRIKATRAGYISRFHDGAEAYDASEAAVLSSGRFEINFMLAAGVATGKDGDGGDLPAGIALRGNYPNPFNTETRITFSLSAPMDVTVTVYDALGREVTALRPGTLSAGEQQLRWDARGADGAPVTSGLYFYRIVGGEGAPTESGRMVVVR